MTPQNFRKKIYTFYAKNRRSFPWRSARDPYRIFVSEVMLQQTQTNRVVKKYTEWINVFPDFKSLAKAQLKDVLKVWQGLGYNRRALMLKKAAEIVMQKYNGVLSSSPQELDTLPGIGTATASAIAAFAFGKPTVFIETNIRAVFIHTFFPRAQKVDDKKLLPLIANTLDPKNPRDWYYALMDYGAILKKLHKNPARKSAHHQKQTTFKGSNRELRGKIVRYILKGPSRPIRQIPPRQGGATFARLAKSLNRRPSDLRPVVLQLAKEGILQIKPGRIFIS